MAATHPTPPPLGEPPDPPIPHFRLKSLSSRMAKLKQPAKGLHLRAVPPAKRDPVRQAMQRAPITRKMAAQAETAQRAKAVERAKPQPSVVGEAAKAAAGEAGGATAERAVKTAKLKRAAAQPAPSASPTPTPAAQPSPAPTPARTPRERVDDLRQRTEDIPPEVLARMQDYDRRSAAARKGQVTRGVNQMVEADEEAGRVHTVDEVADQPSAEPDDRPEHIRAKQRGYAPAAEQIANELPRVGRTRATGRKRTGPPRASDKTTGQLKADARQQIAQWEAIAANTELARDTRLEAQRRANALRRDVLGEKE